MYRSGAWALRFQKKRSLKEIKWCCSESEVIKNGFKNVFARMERMEEKGWVRMCIGRT